MVGLVGLMLVGTAAAQYQATVLPTGSFGPDLFAFDGVGTGNITGNGSFDPAKPTQRHALFRGSPAGRPVGMAAPRRRATTSITATP